MSANDDGVALLELRGGKANAMNEELFDTIERLVDDFERAPERAAVLTGYDRFFSAGLALPQLLPLDRAAMHPFIERFSRAMMRVYACEKPIVAAVNGHAIAGGCVLAIMCDVRVSVQDVTAGDGAAFRIGLNEAQLGIGLPAIVLEPLRATVPATSFAAVALEGRLFTPLEAQRVGLVDEVVATAADLLPAARRRAAAIAARPAAGVAQIKRALRAPVIEAVRRTAAVETERWLDTWFSADARERLSAAVAKIK
jgi:enoyl-CoA hydratase